jgi:preprotein translocase subunit SecE
MVAEGASAGLHGKPGIAAVPRLQIVTVGQVMQVRARAVSLPARQGDTLRRAAREGVAGRPDLQRILAPLEPAGDAQYLQGRDLAQGTPMSATKPLQYVQQVRAEVAKIVWPTRREVILTTVMVFVMAALTAAFFSLVDFAIRSGLSAVLNAF